MKAKKIEFEYFAPGAKRAAVAGNFNCWLPSPMKKTGRGKWKLRVHLKPGRYEYRYLIDEVWMNDVHPVHSVPSRNGSWNCVLEIPA